eukprot:TRINITY_DN1368_c0_g1_i1.p1 TRINITY_DN1368_c0_g1~~TRINITY_DN1368_c0_g1_i1.p1  ORF type:complete len:401 (+),score=145.07 TRINITY_DN1368_c0_g1_i1:157-1203(+)
MGRDFYGILGVPRNANENQIRKAYKKLAVMHHPDKNLDRKEEASKKFKEISEAYEVLSNPEKKKLYDQFGEEGINPNVGGMPSGGGGGFSGFSDQRAQDIFSQVFGNKFGGKGGSSFFSFGGNDMDFEDDNQHGGFSGFNFGGMPSGGMPGGFNFGGGFGNQQHKRPRKPQPVTHEMYFSLEELYHGLTKKVKITRNVIMDDGRTLKAESEVKAFDVKPGWKSGTKITFEGAGDQPSKDAPPGDIIFMIQEKPHHLFKRAGDDLLHTATISLKEALCGGVYNLQHLDGSTLKIPLSNVITPGSVTTISGKGMPISRNPQQKGNLRVTFNVQFPNKITEDQKNKLKNIL